MSERLAFENRTVADPARPDLGTLTVAVLTNPLDVSGHSDELTIDSEPVDVSPEIVKQISKTVVRALRQSDKGYRVDCTAFATMLCGGTYRGIDREIYQHGPLDRRFAIGTLQRLDDVVEAPPLLKPVSFFRNDRGLATPEHTAVSVSDNKDLMIHKLGDGDLVLSDLSTAGRWYDTSHMAIVDGVYITSLGQRVLAYNARATNMPNARVVRVSDEPGNRIVELPAIN